MPTTSLEEIRDLVVAQTADCHDEEGTLGLVASRYLGGDTLSNGGKLTHTARSSFLQRLSIPMAPHGFFDSLSNGLQAAIVQEKAIPVADKPVLLRWSGDHLRAVVSEYYSCVPHLAVVDALLSLDVRLDVRNFWPETNIAEAKAMHIRLTTQTEYELGVDRDIGFTMVHVINSEVGRAALIVEAGIYRLVCTNGLVARVGGRMLLKERHIYSEPSHLISLFSQAVLDAEDAARNFVDVLLNARQRQIPVEQALGLLPSDRMRDLVRNNLRGDTAFDVYNAITQAAQGYTHNAQLEWERWSRQLLDREWMAHDHPVGEICPTCGK